MKIKVTTEVEYEYELPFFSTSSIAHYGITKDYAVSVEDTVYETTIQVVPASSLFYDSKLRSAVLKERVSEAVFNNAFQNALSKIQALYNQEYPIDGEGAESSEELMRVNEAGEFEI